jgi:hypothetical protein
MNQPPTDDIRALLTDATATELANAALTPSSSACPQCIKLTDPLRFLIASPELPNELLARNMEVFGLLQQAVSAAESCDAPEVMKRVKHGVWLLRGDPPYVGASEELLTHRPAAQIDELDLIDFELYVPYRTYIPPLTRLLLLGFMAMIVLRLTTPAIGVFIETLLGPK